MNNFGKPKAYGTVMCNKRKDTYIAFQIPLFRLVKFFKITSTQPCPP